MNRIIFMCMAFLMAIQAFSQEKRTVNPKVTPEELKLYNLMMQYRKANGLPVIPLSKSLTHVAQEHCRDLAINQPDVQPGCNPHSWSDKGKWTSCCYTADHKQSKCMWDKPRELTNYTDDGFEIAAGSSAPEFRDFVMTADYALSTWKGSAHHNNVILNKDIWKGMQWNAIGIGIYNGFSVVWFGRIPDKEGEPAK